MKKYFIAILVFMSLGASAQEMWGPSGGTEGKTRFFLELMGGAVMPSMLYSGNAFESYQSENFISQTEGLGIRMQIKEIVSFSGVFSYREQGVSFPEQEGYLVNANYVSFGLPIELNYQFPTLKKKVSPSVLLFAGPYVGYNIGGSISTNSLDVSITENEFQKLDFGTEAGIGFRFPTLTSVGLSYLCIKASFYRGLNNSFPDPVQGYDADQMSQLLLSNTGSRIHQGFKLTLSYEMSFEKRKMTTFTAGGNGKKTYKRYVNIK